ncbi:Fe-S cluster assembly sulfur transfer protein SufU [Dechloromonas sp. A34]|uniref:Fe-S cluster assembly sulfur transfer protein SufU n=1 Tax=Dechloromonas sp. A34 TaxID=447588 RepID=UPI002248C97D|nr:SUF system NifU family Fe-S cluster assembly protein [Dechloromonas sp. A34]
MSGGLRDLYQEVIVDHGRRPRNFGPLPEASHQAEGFNPLCGDRLTLRLKVVDGTIAEARFEGVGCAISTASASLMTEALKGLAVGDAEALFAAFHAMLTEDGRLPAGGLGKLEVLAGVREFPTRIKCATLAWHTLQAALHAEQRPVSTE